MSQPQGMKFLTGISFRWKSLVVSGLTLNSSYSKNRSPFVDGDEARNSTCFRLRYEKDEHVLSITSQSEEDSITLIFFFSLGILSI